MTTQPTDEAAVGPSVIMLSGRCGRHYDAECQSCKSARECSDAEILRLNAQLTAATRRAEQAEAENAALKHDLERQMTIANTECNRAEQAERMLAERDAALQLTRESLCKVEGMLAEAVEAGRLALDFLDDPDGGTDSQYRAAQAALSAALSAHEDLRT